MEGTAAVTAAAEAARDSGEVRAVEAATADSGEAMVAREGEMEVGGVCQWVFAPTGSSIRSIHQWFLR